MPANIDKIFIVLRQSASLTVHELIMVYRSFTALCPFMYNELYNRYCASLKIYFLEIGDVLAPRQECKLYAM